MSAESQPMVAVISARVTRGSDWAEAYPALPAITAASTAIRLNEYNAFTSGKAQFNSKQAHPRYLPRFRTLDRRSKSSSSCSSLPRTKPAGRLREPG